MSLNGGEQEGAFLALGRNWLDVDGTVTDGLTTNTGSVTWYPTVTCWPYYPTRPIRLTLAEVERLRKAAKADDKLKAILQKFTEQIEITVDFA